MNKDTYEYKDNPKFSIIMCQGQYKCQVYKCKFQKMSIEMHIGEKLQLKTQTKQSPTFHTESVCLCGVSLGFVVQVNLCVSWFVFLKVSSLGNWDWDVGSSGVVNTSTPLKATVNAQL